MPHLDLPQLLPRDVAQFPTGANASSTLINSINYNLTALRHWNYTLYTNNTLSNNSQCYLVFDKYRPVFLSNGTWVNGTTCYVPINGIRERGKLGIAFATLFTVCLFFTLMCLKKHGKQHLREDRRFRLVGRRWQWYWMIFTCACGLIGTISSVDVDRNYLQSIAIILQGFFFYLMYPGTVAIVWEAVRHWGSWQERQIVDVDQYALRQDDRRSKVEFFLPLVFYLFAWLEFFMTIPRSWTPIEKQRSPEQQAAIAEPAGTDTRFKAGAIIMAVAYAIIVYDLKHNLHYYRPHTGGVLTGIKSTVVNMPLKLLLPILILGVRVGYGIACAWIWELSILKYDGNPVWPYAFGYAPSVLIMVVLIIAGMVEENEDRVLIKQRTARGRAADAEMGITRKPAWWRKTAADYMSPEERLRNMTGNFSSRNRNRNSAQRSSRDIQLDDLASPPAYTSSPTSPALGVSSATAPVVGLRDRSRSRPGEEASPFRDESPAGSENAPLRPALDASDRRGSAMTNATQGSGSSGVSGTTLGQQQKIRSMLDV